MNKIYTIGFQPIDIISRDFALIDIINIILENPDQVDNIKTKVINYIKNFKLDEKDFLLVNSISTRSIIPYCPIKNTLIFDPPYVSNPVDILKILDQLGSVVGDKNSLNTYMHAANSLKSLLSYYRYNIPQSVYFNFLTLLTDLNKSDTVAFENEILKFNKTIEHKFKKYAIFFGDVIDIKFFDFLNENGIYVIKFFPYDFFGLPMETLENYYSYNPAFQSPLNILIEIKNSIMNSTIILNNQPIYPEILILNPGGIYLTKDEADFYADNLSNLIKIFMLPGLYNNVRIKV